MDRVVTAGMDKEGQGLGEDPGTSPARLDRKHRGSHACSKLILREVQTGPLIQNERDFLQYGNEPDRACLLSNAFERSPWLKRGLAGPDGPRMRERGQVHG